MPSHSNNHGLNRSDYTIAWVMTLALECDAAVAMLDEVHPEMKREYPVDDNQYILGAIGRYNIVLALLPQDGLSVITAAADRLINRFSSVRTMLMVGIGGGVPSSDIRLGDVVVGNAVFRRQEGVMIKGQDLAPLDHPSRPPLILRNAIKKLDVEEYATKGCKIHENIRKILKAHPQLQKKFPLPDPQTDRLFRAHVVHPKGESDCVASCASNAQNLIHRHDRPGRSVAPEFHQDSDIPNRIHRGSIICADRLITEASWRDELADEKDALCLEMGIAPISHLPCVIIRGISDYADGHPTGKWSGYAAMAAAAYAKDLVTQLNPDALESEKTIGHAITGMKGDLGVMKLKFEYVQKPRRFFRPGRVFAMNWIEPRSNRQGGKTEPALNGQHEPFSKFRRFIVVYQSHNSSWCVPIHTYGGRGVDKPDIRIQDHARIYPSDQGEPAMNDKFPLRDPVAVVTEGCGEARRLHRDSLVNFGKIYTVEYGAQVMNIGYVLKDHSARLELPWKMLYSDRANMNKENTPGDEKASRQDDIGVTKQGHTNYGNGIASSSNINTATLASTTPRQDYGNHRQKVSSRHDDKKRRFSAIAHSNISNRSGTTPAKRQRN